jgi:hypothetical protein
LGRNCLLKRVTEGKAQGSIEGKAIRGRRRKQLSNLKEKKGYYKLKEEALDHTLWRTRFAIVYGPVIRQIAE